MVELELFQVSHFPIMAPISFSGRGRGGDERRVIFLLQGYDSEKTRVVAGNTPMLWLRRADSLKTQSEGGMDEKGRREGVRTNNQYH